MGSVVASCTSFLVRSLTGGQHYLQAVQSPLGLNTVLSLLTKLLQVRTKHHGFSRCFMYILLGKKLNRGSTLSTVQSPLGLNIDAFHRLETNSRLPSFACIRSIWVEIVQDEPCAGQRNKSRRPRGADHFRYVLGYRRYVEAE